MQLSSWNMIEDLCALVSDTLDIIIVYKRNTSGYNAASVNFAALFKTKRVAHVSTECSVINCDTKQIGALTLRHQTHHAITTARGVLQPFEELWIVEEGFRTRRSCVWVRVLHICVGLSPDVADSLYKAKRRKYPQCDASDGLLA